MFSEETFQARVVGALALWACVLGCGGRVGAESENAGPSSAVPRANPAFVPPGSSAPTAPRPAPPRATSPSVPPEAVNPPPQRASPESLDGELGSGLARAATENILSANCGVCHGPLADPGTSGGILFINDVDALVVAGLIVPFNSAGSRIVQVMRDGSMPPRTSGYPPVTEADIDVISGFIDNPRYWPDVDVTADRDAGTAPPPPVLDGGTPAVDPGADAG
jgi:mono/diheme cytochrome c family protein